MRRLWVSDNWDKYVPSDEQLWNVFSFDNQA